MFCMKCGREVDEGQVFCIDCLKEMEKHPVRPGTVVLLPKRDEAHFVRKSQSKRRAAPTPEEQIKILKTRLRIVNAMLLVSLVLMAMLIYPAAKQLLEENRILPGQNYNTVVDIIKEN